MNLLFLLRKTQLTLCALSVRCLCVVCALSVRCLCAVCALSVRCLLHPAMAPHACMSAMQRKHRSTDGARLANLRFAPPVLVLLCPAMTPPACMRFMPCTLNTVSNPAPHRIPKGKFYVAVLLTQQNRNKTCVVSAPSVRRLCSAARTLSLRSEPAFRRSVMTDPAHTEGQTPFRTLMFWPVKYMPRKRRTFEHFVAVAHKVHRLRVVLALQRLVLLNGDIFSFIWEFAFLLLPYRSEGPDTAIFTVFFPPMRYIAQRYTGKSSRVPLIQKMWKLCGALPPPLLSDDKAPPVFNFPVGPEIHFSVPTVIRNERARFLCFRS